MAGLWIRVVAFGFDYLFVAGYLILVTLTALAINAAYPTILPWFFGNPLSGQISGFLLITLPATLYFVLGEASCWQGTWGKRRIGLQVTTLAGRRLSFWRALLRTGLKFLPWELAHTCIWQVRVSGQEDSPLILAGFLMVWLLVGANALCIGVTRTHQAVYDWLAGTVVVRCQQPSPSER